MGSDDLAELPPPGYLDSHDALFARPLQLEAGFVARMGAAVVMRCGHGCSSLAGAILWAAPGRVNTMRAR